MTEWAEMLQNQLVSYAGGIARDAANPLLAGYLAGRTAELHELASRLAAIRTVKDGWFRDSDGSPEGGDAEGGSVHDSAGPQDIAR
jgi:hypothetical protein